MEIVIDKRNKSVSIDKVCERLRAINTHGIEMIIEDFRKAMEE